MKLSEHFSDIEWQCKCGCGQTIVEKELISTAEMIRTTIGYPVIVHCVNRCPEHNARVGGVKNSQHVIGKGMDFHVRGISIRQLHIVLKNMFNDDLIRNLGLYDWGCHIDIREGKHFWDSRTETA